MKIERTTDFQAIPVPLSLCTSSDQTLPKAAPRSWYVTYGKRIFDLAFVLLFAPFICVAVLLLWGVTRLDGAQGFYGHQRVGQDGRPFTCWKIRSMHPDAERVLDDYLNTNETAMIEWQATQKLCNDPRITRFGRFLRRSSLDELPQFWNVLRGDLSVVGPRPITQVELQNYGRQAQAYLSVKPGVTGLWQISARNRMTYRRRVAIDRQYIADISFGKDLSIVAKTVVVMVRRTGL